MASAGLERLHHVVLPPPVTTCFREWAVVSVTAYRRVGDRTDARCVRRRPVSATHTLLASLDPDVDELVQVAFERLHRDQLVVEI